MTKKSTLKTTYSVTLVTNLKLEIGGTTDVRRTRTRSDNTIYCIGSVLRTYDKSRNRRVTISLIVSPLVHERGLSYQIQMNYAHTPRTCISACRNRCPRPEDAATTECQRDPRGGRCHSSLEVVETQPASDAVVGTHRIHIKPRRPTYPVSALRSCARSRRGQHKRTSTTK